MNASDRDERDDAGGHDNVLRVEKWFPYRCSVIANAVSLRLASFYHAKFGLSVHGWRMMAVLGRTSPLSAIELARRTAMDQVSVTRAVNHLTQLGMITRRTDSEDRRRAVLRLSADGRAAYEAIVPLARDLEAVLIAGLTRAELDTLDRLMTRIQRNADSLGVSGSADNEVPAGPAKKAKRPKKSQGGTIGRIRRPYVF